MSTPQESKPPEDDPLARTLDKIGAYSEIGFVNCTQEPFANIDHLDTQLKWNVIPRPLRGKHRKNGELTFGDAVAAMQLGYIVTHPAWEATGRGPMFMGWTEHVEVQPGLMERPRVPTFFHRSSQRYHTTVKEFHPLDVIACDYEIVGKRDAS